ncbi:MAG: phosphomannose isomerase type II C-terminal cupin domain [Ornithinimicrobium sp.]
MTFLQSTHPEPGRLDAVTTTRAPWGSYSRYVANEPVTVKVITVLPGHRLSLQRHNQRAELWQVLDGPMDVVVDDQHWQAASGEMVWVPLGSAHRVANPGPEPARFLEIAFGEFAEDDIERLQDDYNRD